VTETKSEKTEKTETRALDNFSSLSIDGSCIVDISVQEACSLSVTADEKVLGNIKTEVKDDTLQISFKGMNTNSTPKIKVGMPEIESVDISGACKGTMTDIKSKALKINLDGASKLECSGSCDDLAADLSSACELDAAKLISKKCTIDIDGASKAKIFVKDSLNLDASGAARIELLSSPPQITKNVTDAAKLLLSGESSD